jgi:hypothetical protein
MNASAPAVDVSVVESKNLWMLGINAMPAGTSFGWHEGRLYASDGKELRLPSVKLLEQVRAAYRARPEAVFVVEFGAQGPLAEHSIMREILP